MLSQQLLSNVIKVKYIDINNIILARKIMPPRNSVTRHRPRTVLREMSDVEKHMIIAFFHIFEKISVVATLVNHL